MLNLKLAIMLIDETRIIMNIFVINIEVPNTTKNKLRFNFFNLYKKLNSDTNFFNKKYKKKYLYFLEKVTYERSLSCFYVL